MFKTLKNKWGPEICSWVPLDIWHRLLGVQLVLPYYHVVSDQELDHVSGLSKFRTVRQFKEDLEFFLRYYTPVGLQNIINHLDGSSQLPKRCFLLTFDDGYREMYDVVAPILFAKGIPAVFFVTTSFVDNSNLGYLQKMSLLIRGLPSESASPVKREISQILTNAGIQGTDLPTLIRSINYRQRHVLDELGRILACDFAAYATSAQPYLTSAQIRDLMKKGFDIGAHSVDHPLYPDLSLEEQLIQTHESLEWLSNRFQFDCNAFAFPFREVGVAPEFFQSAFAKGRLKVSFGTSGMHRHYFPRNLTRFTMEITNHKAAQILAREFAVNLLRRSPWARP